jgi:hypothetical protein
VRLDPIKQPTTVFDPANPRTVARFVGVALVAQERTPLGALAPFYGSGVYALYYGGAFELYRPLVGAENPIYVGKADPADPTAKTPRDQQQRLHRRLRDHERTIGKATTTLSISDFTCRYLVVQSGWQSAAERYLIDLFQPIWNDEVRICYGIGKHGDDPKTRANLRSPWDTLHPGRDWAHRDARMRDARSRDQISSEIVRHFEGNPPLKSVARVLDRFFADLKQITQGAGESGT